MSWRTIHQTLVLLLAGLLFPGCASPVAPEKLEQADDLTVLKQMQWLDREPPEGFDFGPGGRAGYIERVQREMFNRTLWTEAEREAIRAHRVEVGMTMEQVVTAIGWPREYPGLLWAYAPGTDRNWADDVEVRIRRAEARRWTYGDGPNNLRVFFDKSWIVQRIIDNREQLGTQVQSATRWPLGDDE
jgi:hypothetical protein